MKKQLVIFLFLLSIASKTIAQQKFVKTFKVSATTIEIDTKGVDAIEFLTSDTEAITVELVGYDAEIHHFNASTQAGLLKITVDYAIALGYNTKTEKYCVVPPNNVTAVVHIPKGKQVRVFGDQLDISSSSFQGDLEIAITKGNIYLNLEHTSAIVRLFSGNVFALIGDRGLAIETRNGEITLDGATVQNPYNTPNGMEEQLKLISVHANVVLSTKNEQ